MSNADYVKIIDSKDPTPKQILYAAKAGEIDLYVWAEEGFGPDSRVIYKPNFYKLDFAGHAPIREQFFTELKGRGHAVPPLSLSDGPVKEKDLLVNRNDITILKEKLAAEEKLRLLDDKKPLKLRAALAAQKVSLNGEKEKIKKLLSDFPLRPGEKRLSKTAMKNINTMIKRKEVDIANKVWKELYLDGKNSSPKKGHIDLIKDHLHKQHDIEKKSNKAQRIAGTINPAPKGGAPKTLTTNQPHP